MCVCVVCVRVCVVCVCVCVFVEVSDLIHDLWMHSSSEGGKNSCVRLFSVRRDGNVCAGHTGCTQNCVFCVCKDDLHHASCISTQATRHDLFAYRDAENRPLLKDYR